MEKNVITDKLIESVFLIYYKNKSLDDVSYYNKVKWLNNVSKISLKLCNKIKKNDTSFYEERRKIMAY